MRILLMAEEGQSAQYLRKGLLENGFVVDVVGAESRGVDTAHNGYDLLVCNVGPGRPGLSELRRTGPQAPVLFLADRSAMPPRADGQAENFLLKPFAFSDFLARVRGLLRPGTDHVQMTLRIADLELDLVRHRASRAGKRLDLTPKEFLLLSLLMRKPGEVLSRTLIADQVWEINFDSNTNFVDVHIRRLRSKVDDPFPKKLIHTMRGMGYVLEER
ncbi:MAG TPA: winged helix-turn-helix domain-containing protein [Bryobacteraceae bacterium]|jgi:two-component system copper resistance phosphate regulon response regulator CusR|nr:winged helix-turn-helix domain-containing protein [Bryobacteraceae bacterium]